MRLRRYFKTIRVWPTEAIFFHLGLLLVVLSSILARLGYFEWLCILLYVLLSLLAYWFIAIFLRRPGILAVWWENQVLSSEVQRFSAGVVIILLKTIHLLIFFVSLLLVSANVLFIVERGETITTWVDAVYWTLMFGIVGGIGEVVPKTVIGRFLSVFDSLIGLILAAFWVAIWMKAFESVFQFFRGD